MENSIVLFQQKEVRRTYHNDQWWFVIVDIVAVLTDSINPTDYLKKIRKRDIELAKAYKGEGQIVPPLSLILNTGGGSQNLKSWNTPGILRLIQSIPSPKAEPFKLWLAKVGHERLLEIENPELTSQRIREIYQQKGYSQEWIEKRMRGIAVRDELTDEWKKRGVKEQREYAILTAEISKATFGMTPAQYREFKSLKTSDKNLRDHMTDLELIFTMLGEASTTEIAKKKDAQGFPENKQAAKAGGMVAGNARKELETKSGTSVSTPENHLELLEAKRKAITKSKNKKQDKQ